MAQSEEKKTSVDWKNLVSREDFTEYKNYIGWKILSFLIPIVGVVLYFVFKETELKKATACLAWALVGIVLHIICMIL